MNPSIRSAELLRAEVIISALSSPQPREGRIEGSTSFNSINMHDLHVADKIQKLVIENAKENNLQTITKIVINLGFVEEHGSDISPENLDFNLKMLLKGSIGENAEIVINKNKSNTWELVSISGE